MSSITPSWESQAAISQPSPLSAASPPSATPAQSGQERQEVYSWLCAWRFESMLTASSSWPKSVFIRHLERCPAMLDDESTPGFLPLVGSAFRLHPGVNENLPEGCAQYQPGLRIHPQ